MPIEAPILDDRTYDQLREELTQRLTVYNPEYTDQLPTDPIITLLELVASLGETVLYRFNQIPDATRHEFLRLLGIRLRAAAPSSAIVSFSRTSPLIAPLDPETVGPTVGRDTVVRAGDVAFVVDQALDVLPLFGVGAIKHEVKADSLSDDVSGIPVDGSVKHYRVVAVDPEAPAALDPAVDSALWIALVADDKPLAGIDLASLRAALPARVVSLGVMLDDVALEPEYRSPYDDADATGSDLICEMLTSRPPDGAPVYTRCDLVSDTSRGLRRSGVLKLVVPTLGELVSPSPGNEGVDNNPPVLPKPSDNERALLWLRISRRSSADKLSGAVRWVGVNAVGVTQGEWAGAELLGTGAGTGRQTMRLTKRNPDPSTLAVDVEEADGEWIAWTLVESLADAGPRDRCYELDAEAGTVQCGDGEYGLPFPGGRRIRVRDYVYWLGSRGNVAAGAINKVDIGGLSVSNFAAAQGGTDAERPELAVERIPQEIRRRDRAVTASDFRELVLGMPGVEVGRAETLMTCRPSEPEVLTPGAVTVVVWPTAPLLGVQPKPTRTTLDRVCRYLDPRRLATTELYIAAPIYLPIAVSVAVVPVPGHEREAATAFVAQLIRQYLAALPPYGPDGDGYPLGRTLYAAELSAVALQVASVRFISELRLAKLGKQGEEPVWIATESVRFGRTQLPSLEHIEVASGGSEAEAPAFPPLTPPTSTMPPTLRPVPIATERC